MTPEKQQLVTNLKELRTLFETKNKLSTKHSKLIEENEKEKPIAPLKKGIASLTPRITGVEIRFTIAFILSIIMIIVSISTFIKIRKINDLVDNPGESYNEWCETLVLKGFFDKMTEEEWKPIQEDWEKQGITVTWDDVVKINEKDEINIYSGRIAYVIFEEKLDSLPQTGGFCAFIAIVGIVLMIVWRKGFLDLLTTSRDIFDIPKKKKQNQINHRYNQTEYKELLNIYEKNMTEYNEKTLLLKNTCEHEMSELDVKIKGLHEQLHHEVPADDITFIISDLERGIVETIGEYYRNLSQMLAEIMREEREAERNSSFLYSSIGSSYESEVRRHNSEMERMERERMQMEKDRAWAEKREFEKAKERERDEKRRAEWQAHQKDREERREIRHKEIAGMNKCSHCVNSAKCSIQAKYNSLNCGSYRPR